PHGGRVCRRPSFESLITQVVRLFFWRLEKGNGRRVESADKQITQLKEHLLCIENFTHFPSLISHFPSPSKQTAQI
ncbi:hypothetical protein ACPDHL_12465, partial [Myroides sp. C15-4]|uniref:hypothetical protein n=1 Tax=Myroides sp. C15-4 TaxID=3400532 RepID=UPI003D2F5C93